MISMTGYAAKELKLHSIDFFLVIRCLNSTKGLDLSLKLPRYLSVMESSIRQLISKAMIRGKVSVSITDTANNMELDINEDTLKAYIKKLSTISPNSDSGDVLNAAISLPNIFSHKSFEFTPSINIEITSLIKQALNEVQSFRIKEGKKLQKEVVKYIRVIQKTSKLLPALERKKNKQKKDKIFMQLNSNNNINYDPSRLESEMIYYFEKHDITEEVVRLDAHCDFFMEVINKENVMGKKLNFISQEILREINTIGSKANNFEIQKNVIRMKEEIEKIKEQIQNIL
tara:strand:- start:400 stop:1257 length:858 start_codon:yes stop_codon:yes gene_type:complete